MPSLTDKLRKVKMLILDVDGVLTDGKMYYKDDGELLKVFHVQDGLGVHIASKVGIKIVVLTAKDTPLLRRRAEEMHIAELITGVVAKHQKLPYLLEKYKVAPEDICFVGDDLVDLELLKNIGVPVAVKNACPEVKEHVVYVTERHGGDGAVREVVELILKAQERWQWVLENLPKVLLP